MTEGGKEMRWAKIPLLEPPRVGNIKDIDKPRQIPCVERMFDLCGNVWDVYPDGRINWLIRIWPKEK